MYDEVPFGFDEDGPFLLANVISAASDSGDFTREELADILEREGL